MLTIPGEAAKVLIVDDDKEIRTFLTSVFSPHYHCVTACDGHEAIRHALSDTPDLIVTDLRMPVMDGMEMTRRMRKHGELADVPVVMLTGSEAESSEKESLTLDIDAFITKPFDADVLLMRVGKLIERKRKSLPSQAKTEQSVKQEIVLSEDEQFLAEITKMIEDRIDDFELNVNSLSDAMGMNTKQLYRKLKQVTGLSPRSEERRVGKEW